MIVNKSMFPLQTGFSILSKMQDKFATLQMQLGTGVKAQSLADMGRDLPVSLSVRSRLSTIEGYSASIEQVSLRLSFFDNALTRMDEIEGQARNSAVQGQYGTNNINMATIPSLSKARLDEVVTMLNSDIAGRYLFGGNVTDKAPLPETDEILNGVGGKAGFRTVVTERKAADAGLDGRGRLASTNAAPSNVVTLAEDGVHPFGFKLSTMSTTSSAVTVTQPVPGTAPLGDQVGVTFAPAPAAQIAEGETITFGFTLPDGTETQLTMKAVTASSGAAGQFVIGADANATAANFKTALDAELVSLGKSELAAASTFAASQNFFNGAGEPILRVQGTPATATALRIATPADTVSWYSGQSPSVSAVGLGRLDLTRSTNTVQLVERSPVSPDHGFQISASSGTTASPTGTVVTSTGGNPASMSVAFGATAAAGDTVNLTLTDPNGKSRSVTLTAVSGLAGPGQFTVSPTADPNETAANFEKALKLVVSEAAADAEGNPRQSVSAAIEDSGRVNYGMQANESGYLNLMRSLASMSVETYPADTAEDKNRFDAMARRQQLELSESRNTERGSIELVTMELGVARAALGAAEERHTNYQAQLENLLSDVETVSKEDVAMEILALQTRLTASYQVTSMVSQLSLVNFLR